MPMAPSKKRHRHTRDQRAGRERQHGREHHKGKLNRSPSPDPVSMAETPEVFRYEPLDPSVDSIRLLELEPADNQQILRCRIIHVPFRKRPKYEALSYTWGSPELTSTILLNGTPMAIRPNLHDALLALRRDHEPRLIWADAICTDQSNLAERERQVRFMDSIYSRAARVLIWLGGADQIIQTAFKSDLENLKESERNTFCSWICGHKYWTRLWIIQEFTLSQDLRVCIGRQSEKWEAFLESFSQHAGKYDKLSHQMRIIKNLDQKRRGRLDDTSRLEKLLEDFRYAECQEPRDRIYGLLGLAHDCQDQSIKADYTKSTFDLYTEVMGKFSRTQRTLKGRRSSTAFDRSMRVVYFSQLVSSILGRPVYPHSETGTRILAIAAVAGEILDLGPTHVEILDDARKLKLWKSAYQTHYTYPPTQKKVREAIAAYDYFLYQNSHRIAIKVFSIDLNRTYSRGREPRPSTPVSPRRPSTADTFQRGSLDLKSVPEFSWDSNEAHWLSENLDDFAGVYRRSDPRSLSRRTHSRSGNIARTTGYSRESDLPPEELSAVKNRSRSPRSLIEIFFSSNPTRPTALAPALPSKNSSSPRLFLGTNKLVGSVPANAKKGDIICQFWNTDVTALLRRRAGASYFEVVGKVYLSTGYMDGLQAKFRERMAPKDGTKAVLIEMDLRALSRLTS
jgi:hypothetical protein